jgi:hypothetical protein
MEQRLYAFTLANRLKLASLPAGGGTVERLSSIMSADLVLDGTEQQIPFDPAQTSRSDGFTVNAGGSFTVDNDGYYDGSLGLFVDKSGGAGADLSIWVERKPLLTGVWELASTGMSNPVIYDDGGQPFVLSGNFDALAGDEFRVMIKENSGSATLKTSTKAVALGSISNYAATLSVRRVGPVSA